MKRAAFLYSLILICLVANLVTFGQSNAKSSAKPDAGRVCPFSIIGMWKSDATPEPNSIFFNFSPEGWVTLLGPSADTLPQDFEMIAEVNYKLDKPTAPKSIEFTATRGNDAFPRGVTLMEITEYSDNSFTTLDHASGQQARWVRVQTHLYFLTFAARPGPLPQGGPAFVMWTVLDGRKTEVEALGIQLTRDDAGKTIPAFGPIPAELYNHLTDESDKDKKGVKEENVFMRLELTEAEFETTHKIYQTWDGYVKMGKLPYDNQYLNGMEFIRKSAESLNQCGEKLKLLSLTERERDEILSKHAIPQFLFEYIRVMRKKNDEIHINNRVFPWQWRPMIPGTQAINRVSMPAVVHQASGRRGRLAYLHNFVSTDDLISAVGI